MDKNELSLEEIKKLRDRLPEDVELEAFVHGAMCMAFSGRCILSSFLANRSGNRGECSQPCRWNYSLAEEKRPGEFFPDGFGFFGGESQVFGHILSP